MCTQAKIIFIIKLRWKNYFKYIHNVSGFLIDYFYLSCGFNYKYAPHIYLNYWINNFWIKVTFNFF